MKSILYPILYVLLICCCVWMMYTTSIWIIGIGAIANLIALLSWIKRYHNDLRKKL